MLNVIFLSIRVINTCHAIMLSVVLLNGVMLVVVAPSIDPEPPVVFLVREERVNKRLRCFHKVGTIA